VNRQSILDRLNTEASDIRRRFGVKDIAVFGSVARDEDREGSDLDVLVTFEGTTDFDRFMGLKLYLEDTFGRSVDLGTPDTLRPELRSRVERDLIHVP
jgi:uncharacterized protein